MQDPLVGSHMLAARHWLAAVGVAGQVRSLPVLQVPARQVSPDEHMLPVLQAVPSSYKQQRSSAAVAWRKLGFMRPKYKV